MTLEDLLPYWPDRDVTKKIWRFERDAIYCVFTNGHFLIAQRIDGDGAQYDPIPYDVCERLLTEADGASYMNVTRTALLEFCGEIDYLPELPAKCPHCDGTGKTNSTCEECGHEHECTCEECVNGLRIPDLRPAVHGRYGPLTINSRYVRLVVEALVSDAYELATTTTIDGSILIVRSGDDIAFIMSMKDELPEMHPVFTLMAEGGAAALWDAGEMA